MTRPLLHFTHATGVPSGSYGAFFSHLEADVITLPLISHEPAYPVEQEWDALVEQLCASIRTQADRPVIGIGHSLGGALHFMAAQRHPELYRGLVLLEPALLSRRSVWLHRLLRAGLRLGVARPPPLFRLRRESWASRAEAEESLGGKALYRRFHEECRQGFFQHGLVAQPDGSIRLRFTAANESLIYQTAPLRHLRRYRQRSSVPGMLLYGKESDLVAGGAGKWLQRQHGFTVLPCEGSHFFPLEYPQATADRVNASIRSLYEVAG